MKTLIIYKSIHLGSTKKIAEKLAKKLDADLLKPEDFTQIKIEEYDLIGLGSGIYGDKHHPTILNLIDNFPNLKGKKVFIFSTAGIIYERAHRCIKIKLNEKDAELVDEFYCRGLNKNSFLKYFGGMNKGRPNSEDFKRAEDFARKMVEES